MDLGLFLACLPPIAYMGWTDYKKHTINVQQLAELGVIALTYKLIFIPASLYGSLVLGLLSLILGMWLFEAYAFSDGDMYALGLIGFAVPPVDYILFFSIAISSLLVFAMVKKIVKSKKVAGLPVLIWIFAAYSLALGLGG